MLTGEWEEGAIEGDRRKAPYRESARIGRIYLTLGIIGNCASRIGKCDCNGILTAFFYNCLCLLRQDNTSRSFVHSIKIYTRHFNKGLRPASPLTLPNPKPKVNPSSHHEPKAFSKQRNLRSTLANEVPLPSIWYPPMIYASTPHG
jgi:hypothetical protein